MNCLILFFLTFQCMLSSQRVASRIRAFDLILNLGVHAQLLEPMLHEDPPPIDEAEPLQEPPLTIEEKVGTQGKMDTESNMQRRMASAVDNFESWLLAILFEILSLLVQVIVSLNIISVSYDPLEDFVELVSIPPTLFLFQRLRIAAADTDGLNLLIHC